MQAVEVRMWERAGGIYEVTFLGSRGLLIEDPLWEVSIGLRRAGRIKKRKNQVHPREAVASGINTSAQRLSYITVG